MLNQSIDGQEPSQWVEKTVAQLSDMDNVMLLPRSTVFGYYDHNLVGINERRTDHLGEHQLQSTRQRVHKVRAKQVILATGAHERPLVYGNNDVPGCMLANAVSTYINRYDVVPGKQLVLMTTNDNAYKTAIDWHQAAVKWWRLLIRGASNGDLVNKAKQLGITIFFGHGVIEVKGSKRVKGVDVRQLMPITTV